MRDRFLILDLTFGLPQYTGFDQRIPGRVRYARPYLLHPEHLGWPSRFQMCQCDMDIVRFRTLMIASRCIRAFCHALITSSTVNEIISICIDIGKIICKCISIAKTPFLQLVIVYWIVHRNNTIVRHRETWYTIIDGWRHFPHTL